MPKRLFREIEKLKKEILKLSAVVEQAVYDAVKSVSQRDLQLAEALIKVDREIDEAEVEIEEECLKLIALHQPVANDLRYIVAVLKINNDLERIGDLSQNIAQRAVQLAAWPQVRSPVDLLEMAGRVKEMLRKGLSALIELDPNLSREVLASDDEVDALHRNFYSEVGALISASPNHAEALIALLSVSRNLERIADHATNIAEDVIYMAEGVIARHGRNRA